MFRGRVSSWNLRDRHMVETLDALVGHLDRDAAAHAKVVVWAHNSHLGDARATEMGERRRVERRPARPRAPRRRRGPGRLHHPHRHGDRRRRLGRRRPSGSGCARPAGQLRGAFHEAGLAALPAACCRRRAPTAAAADLLGPRRLERAIGVIYRPETERLSHYFHAGLPDQFDAVIHFDETTAVAPLELVARLAFRRNARSLPERAVVCSSRQFAKTPRHNCRSQCFFWRSFAPWRSCALISALDTHGGFRFLPDRYTRCTTTIK